MTQSGCRALTERTNFARNQRWLINISRSLSGEMVYLRGVTVKQLPDQSI